jgi:hypothetical protein
LRWQASPGFLLGRDCFLIVGHYAQITAVELHARVRSAPGGQAGQLLDQGSVRQSEGGPGRLGRHADRERVPPGVGGDHFG